MPFQYNQDSFWDGASFFLEDLNMIPGDHRTFFEGRPHEHSIDTSNQQYMPFGDSSTIASPGWTQMYPPIGEAASPSNSKLVATNTSAQSSTLPTQAPRKPSAEAVARRRKQNRVSQAAWRARNKELVEELRQEINEHSEYNQFMHQTMQNLLETTESLKGIILRALATAPPQASQDIRRVMGTDEQLLSPESSHEGPMQEYEGNGQRS